MTQCRQCANNGDCWIKATMETKKGHRMTDLNERDQRIVINASNGSCDCFTEGSE